MAGRVGAYLEGEGFRNLAMLVGRILLGLPFPIFGVSKYLHQQQIGAVIETAGIPGWVVYFIIPYQILCGLAVWLGFQTRWAAFLLGGFCIVAPCLYHADWSRPNELAMFTKDFATAGGFLFLWLFGPGRYSVDAWLKKRSAAG